MSQAGDSSVTRTKPEPGESLLNIYLGGAIGAFCFALGDSLRNSQAAAVEKIYATMNSLLANEVPLGRTAALVVIVGLGIVACWLHRPRTRADAFARGVSVFALLTVTAPFEPAPPISEAGLVPDPAAMSAPASVTDAARSLLPLPGREVVFARQDSGSGSDDKEPARGKAKVLIESAELAKKLESALVTLKDKDSGLVLGREKVIGGVLSIERPAGSYVLEFESPGFRITQADIVLGESDKAYAVRLAPSMIPLGLQRFVGPKDARLVDAGGDAAARPERGQDPPAERP